VIGETGSVSAQTGSSMPLFVEPCYCDATCRNDGQCPLATDHTELGRSREPSGEQSARPRLAACNPWTSPRERESSGESTPINLLNLLWTPRLTDSLMPRPRGQRPSPGSPSPSSRPTSACPFAGLSIRSGLGCRCCALGIARTSRRVQWTPGSLGASHRTRAARTRLTVPRARAPLARARHSGESGAARRRAPSVDAGACPA